MLVDSSSTLNDHRTIQRHSDLQGLLGELERRGLLVSVDEPVSLVHEIAALHQKVLHFDQPKIAIGSAPKSRA